jgi:hypothetical protein
MTECTLCCRDTDPINAVDCTMKDCPMNIAYVRDPLLVEREKTHGSFIEHATITQALKDQMHHGANWSKLSCRHKESLEMIQHKIGRILGGNPEYKDHWDDIAGYAKLASEACS